MIVTQYLTYYETLEEQLTALFDELSTKPEPAPSVIDRAIHILNRIMEHRLMATQKTTPQTATKTESWQKTFVNYTLNEKDKKNLALLVADDKRIVDLLTKTIEQGYEVKLAFNNKLRTFSCTLYSTAATAENSGLALSGLGRSVRAAMASALYKHDTVFGGKAWSSSSETAEEFA